ncbi:MAG: heme-binding protein [Gammaproteobacteria bacterium]|nr:heme-binding protein [Gammaproteobacteria bacterium]NNM21202.1 heme-binding protein [Gammaproteobacteria bacterium]
MANEEPDYEVLMQTDEYEIRHYEPYIVAEVDVDGGLRDSGGSAFRILAGYIFGNNQSAEKMEMTTPVETRPAESGTRMAMTAPVLSEPAGEQRYTYAFVMEQKYSLETLPVPNDPRIRIHKTEPRTVAVKRYSGLWTEKNYTQNEQALLKSLQQDNIRTDGEPMLARYNGPATPWFLRRNEVIVEVEWAERHANR